MRRWAIILIGQLLFSLSGTAYAQPFTHDFDCAGRFIAPQAPSSKTLHATPHHTTGALFDHLRLGAMSFSYTPQGEIPLSLSAKVFLAGRDDLLPIRWQALRSLVISIFIDHLWHHAWWTDGRHKNQVSVYPLSTKHAKIIEQGITVSLNNSFAAFDNFARDFGAQPLNVALLAKQLNNHGHFLRTHSGSREEGLQVRFSARGGQLYLDGEFWHKVKEQPALYQNFLPQVEKALRIPLTAPWIDTVLKDLFAFQGNKDYAQLAQARYHEVVSLLALIQVLGRSDIVTLPAEKALAEFADLKAQLEDLPEINLVLLASRPPTGRPWGHQLVRTRIIAPDQFKKQELPHISIVEAKSKLDNLAWPIEQIAVKSSPDEIQAWKDKLSYRNHQNRLVYRTKIEKGPETNIRVNVPFDVLPALQNRFTSAKQLRWDHRDDRNYGVDAAITDIVSIVKALQIMLFQHKNIAGQEYLPVQVKLNQGNTLFFASGRIPCDTFYLYDLGYVVFHDVLPIK